jgi:Tol biopolymer transport system component
MDMLMKIITAAMALSIAASLAGQTADKPHAQPADKQKNAVAASVARMARVGSANSPRFSPDGKWVSFISNMSGSPQVWIVPSGGGYPRMVTNGDDPVTEQQWSPASDWIAVGIAPGGGLNTQIYVVKADGTGMKLLTGGWTGQQRL